MASHVLNYEVHRRTDLEGRTLYFMIYSGSRRRQHTFFEPSQVPAFEGASAWFAIERDHRGGWTFLRQVEGRFG
ncbi:hypothetical protein ACO2Q3_24445 [Caulobacter sp. KR2-114]|jgi:hypothetical protein|uniref:hypothetical protein n=1 Tax=Caulobacter sp. KR2-114 TaxID=3400912 RepID=UPI003C0C0FF5